MATKKVTAATNLTDPQKQTLTAAGIDWAALFAKLGPFAAQVLQIILGLLVTKTAAKKAVKAGCCDHAVCCEEVLASALMTASLAADHCCQCADEPATP